MGGNGRHTPSRGSKRSTVSRYEVPSKPPAAYSAPPSAAPPIAKRPQLSGASSIHASRAASYRSVDATPVVVRTAEPSPAWPPPKTKMES
jgi:hypothetical protein